MKKLTHRILSLFMVFTMMLSLSPPVIAYDGAEPPAQTQTETEGTVPSEGETEQTETDPVLPEGSHEEETPVSPDPVSDPDPKPEGKEEETLPPPPPTTEQAEAAPSAAPASAGDAAAAPAEAPASGGDEAAPLPRLTARYDRHRIHYIDSPKHPLSQDASLSMGEIDEEEIPYYLKRAAGALGLESCGMYLYFIADPLIEDAATAEILHFTGNPDDPEDRMTVEITLFDDENMTEAEKEARLQELRNIHIEDLQVILMGPYWEDDAVTPHSYDEDTGVIRFQVEKIGGFMLFIPDWESAVPLQEEVPENPEDTPQELQNIKDTGTEVISDKGKDEGTDQTPDAGIIDNTNPSETVSQDESTVQYENPSESTEDTPAAPAGEQTVTASGADYSVSLTYSDEANIPEGSVFELSEVSDSGILYEHLTDSVANTLNTSSDEIVSVTFVDVDVKKDGESVTPDSAVNLSIAVDDSAAGDTVTQVVALGTENEILSKTDDSSEAAEGSAAFSTETESLSSTYAIVRITKQAKLHTSDDQTYLITVSYDRDDPAIPADVELVVTELLKGTPEYEEYVAASAAATGADPETLGFAKAFDISLIDPSTGAECQPTKEVSVNIQLLEETVEENDQIEVVHFGAEEAPKQIECAVNQEDNTVEFATPGFSVFVIMQVIKEQVLTASDGQTYKITVSYDRDSGIPEEAQLVVSDIREGDEAYESYVAQSAEKVGADPEDLTFARVFDITLENPETGEKYQPDSGVKVSVQLLDEDVNAESQIDVVHFGDEVEALDCALNSQAIEFETNGFSVYVIIEHEGDDDVTTPRFTIHFITPNSEDYTPDHDEASNTYTYTSSPYLFKNKRGGVQTTLIVRDGEGMTDNEALELITNPPNRTNKFFYGWYIVDMKSDTTAWDTTDSTWKGAIQYSWPLSDLTHVIFEKPMTVVDNGDGTFTMTWSDGTNDYTVTADKNESDYSAHIYVAPVYDDYCFVNFHELAYAVASTDNNLLTRKLVVLGDDKKEDVLISNVVGYPTDPIRKIFRGWQYRHGSTWVSVQTIDDHNEIIPRTIEVTENVDLYPYYQEGRWLYFNVGDSGNGAQYVPAQFELAEFNDQSPGGEASVGGVVESLPVTSRVGWDFGGWQVITDNTDPDNPVLTQVTDANGKFLEGLTLSIEETYKDNDGNEHTGVAYTIENKKLRLKYPLSSLTFYALWNQKADANVTVVVWKQKVTDNVNAAKTPEEYAADLNSYLRSNPDKTEADFVAAHGSEYKHYDYYLLPNGISSSFTTNSGNTLADISSDLSIYRGLATNTDTSSEFIGFSYSNTSMSTSTVQGDGSTVVNVYYDRKVSTLTFKENNTTIKTITELYGAQIGHYFNEEPLNRGYSWEDQGNPKYYNYVLVSIEVMPEVNVTLKGTSGNRPRTIYYYTELLPGETSENQVTYNGKIFSLYKTVKHSYKFITYDEEYHPITGFGRDRLIYAVPAFGSNYNADSNGIRYASSSGSNVCADNQAPIGSNEVGKNNENYLYYTRNGYSLTFNFNYPVATGKDPNYSKSVSGVLYQSPLDAYNYYTHPDDLEKAIRPTDDELVEHYTFGGWYEDQACTTQFDFNSEMPAADKVVYGKWTADSYLVSIDPNGGVIDHINYDVETDGGYPTFYLTGMANADGSDDPKWQAAVNAIVAVFGSYDTGWISTLKGTKAGHNTSQSTYFSAGYGTAIGQYELQRNYAKASSSEIADPEITKYYYAKMCFNEDMGTWGVHADMRNALYLTSDQISAYYKYCLAEHAWIDTYWKELKGPDYVYYDGALPANLDAFWAKYVEKYTKDDGTEDYRQYVYKPGAYAFVGWYTVVDDAGNISENPYNFTNQVEGPISLKAVWREVGQYYLVYDPIYDLTLANGRIVRINGNLDEWTDPSNPRAEKYNDEAKTTTLQQPTGLTADGQPAADDYVFRGWRIVKMGSDGKYVAPRPNEYYYEAVPFIIHADDADSNGVIHMQAVYQEVNASDRRPYAADLKLNANGGYLTDGSSGELSADKDITDESSWNGVGTVKENAAADEIEFSSMQSNFAVHLLRYAVTAGTLARFPNSKNYFAHESNYLLLGFDEGSDYTLEATSTTDDNLKTGQAFVPTFPADSVIAATRGENKTLYAVWEPMVYVTFTNRTKENVTFMLEGPAAAIVNKVTGTFSREAVEDQQTITLTPAGTDGAVVKVVMPKGAEKQFTVTGTNTSTSQLLTVTSMFNGETTGTSSAGLNRPSGAEFNLIDTAKEGPEGVFVYFDGLDTVYYDVNGGVWGDNAHTGADRDQVLQNPNLHYVKESTGLPYEPLTIEVNVPKHATKPDDPTRTETGKTWTFLGWTSSREAATCDPAGFTLPGADEAAGISNFNVILDSMLWDFAADEVSSGMTLYAIWGETVTVTFYLPSGRTWNSGNDGNYFVRVTNNREYKVTLYKGEAVKLPIAPTWNNNTTSRLFYRWVTVNTFEDQYFSSSSSITDVYAFGTPVTQNLALYSSWIVANHVDVTVSKTVKDYNGANATAEQKNIDFTFVADITTTTYTGTIKTNNNSDITTKVIEKTTTVETQTITLKDGQRSTLPLYFYSQTEEQDVYYPNKIYTFTIYFQSVSIKETSDPNYSVEVNGQPTDSAIVDTMKSGTAPDFKERWVYGYYKYDYCKLVGTAEYSDKAKVNLAFKNTKDRTDLIVSKKVLHDLTADGFDDPYFTGNEEFAYTAVVKKADGTVVAPAVGTGYRYTVQGDKSAAFTLKDGESITLRGVPIGGNVVVTEANAGFEAVSMCGSVTGNTSLTLGNVSKDEVQTIAYTNKRLFYDVTFRNWVEDETYGDRDKLFTYTATLYNGNSQVAFPNTEAVNNALQGKGTFSNARKTLTFRLKHNQALTIPQLPGGLRLNVVQTGDSNYRTTCGIVENPTTESLTYSFDPINDAKTIYFVNTLKMGTYKIHKSVQLQEGQTIPEKQTFTFTAKLLKTVSATTPEVLSTSIQNMVSALDASLKAQDSVMSAAADPETRTITFVLLDGKEAELKNLPVGYFLQVAESAPGFASYVSNIRTDSSTVQISERGGNITFVNRLASVVLKVLKIDEEAALENPAREVPLKGAKFRLYYLDGGSETTLRELTSDDDGYLFYTENNVKVKNIELENKIYFLQETSASPGYNKRSEVFRIVVDDKVTDRKDQLTAQVRSGDSYVELALPDSLTYKNEENLNIFTLKLTNKTGVNVKFRKIDGFGNPLNGASFKLYSDEACSVEVDKVPVAVSSSQEAEIYNGTSWSGNGYYNGIVTLEMVPNGIYYMMETAAPAGYRTGDRFVVVVGEEYMTKSDDPVWGSGGVLERISQGDMDAQNHAQITEANGDYGNKNYAIFRLSGGKADPDTDIVNYGLMNTSAVSRKVILRKTDGSFNPKAGAQFQIYSYDGTLITTTEASKESGVVWVGHLPLGTYYLREIAAPAGYEANAGKYFKLEVRSEGVSSPRMIDAPDTARCVVKTAASAAGGTHPVPDPEPEDGWTVTIDPAKGEYHIDDVIQITLSDGTRSISTSEYGWAFDFVVAGGRVQWNYNNNGIKFLTSGTIIITATITYIQGIPGLTLEDVGKSVTFEVEVINPDAGEGDQMLVYLKSEDGTNSVTYLAEAFYNNGYVQPHLYYVSVLPEGGSSIGEAVWVHPSGEESGRNMIPITFTRNGTYTVTMTGYDWAPGVTDLNLSSEIVITGLGQ